MVDKTDPSKIVRGITASRDALNRFCRRSQTLGLIAKVGDLKQSRYGMVVSPPASESDPYVTLVNHDLNSVLVMQPSVDHFASWSEEARECIDIIDHLRSNHWQGLPLRRNGGSVVAEEIENWAKLGKTRPLLACPSRQRQRCGARTNSLRMPLSSKNTRPCMFAAIQSWSMRTALVKLGAVVARRKARQPYAVKRNSPPRNAIFLFIRRP